MNEVEPVEEARHLLVGPQHERRGRLQGVEGHEPRLFALVEIDADRGDEREADEGRRVSEGGATVPWIAVDASGGLDGDGFVERPAGFEPVLPRAPDTFARRNPSRRCPPGAAPLPDREAGFVGSIEER